MSRAPTYRVDLIGRDGVAWHAIRGLWERSAVAHARSALGGRTVRTRIVRESDLSVMSVRGGELVEREPGSPEWHDEARLVAAGWPHHPTPAGWYVEGIRAVAGRRAASWRLRDLRSGAVVEILAPNPWRA